MAMHGPRSVTLATTTRTPSRNRAEKNEDRGWLVVRSFSSRTVRRPKPQRKTAEGSHGTCGGGNNNLIFFLGGGSFKLEIGGCVLCFVFF